MAMVFSTIAPQAKLQRRGDTSNAGERDKLHVPVKVSWGFITRSHRSIADSAFLQDAADSALKPQMHFSI
jgi:hypothetical protein